MARQAQDQVIVMAKQNRVRWNLSKSAAENASLKLPALAQAYFRSGRAIFGITFSLRALHRFRLDTKRFRYTLELFAPCYGPGLERRLVRLRKIQDFLGEINDCLVTRELLGRRRDRVSNFLERRMAAKTGAVRSYWRETFDADGQERWWTGYLAHFARK
jgi:CHAD domain-containing protein